MSDRERSKEAPIGWAAFPELFGPAIEYATDLVQRQILFWDTLRQRGNQYRESAALVTDNLGEPAQPTCVLAGDGFDSVYVDIGLLCKLT